MENQGGIRKGRGNFDLNEQSPYDSEDSMDVSPEVLDSLPAAVKQADSTHRRHDPQNLFQEGDEVDVRLEEEGLHGSWHRAKVCAVKPGLRLVEYFDLVQDVKGAGVKLRDWISFGKQDRSVRPPRGTKVAENGKSLLRPAGPGLPPYEPFSAKAGGWPRDLWVEVLESGACWEGILRQHIWPAMVYEPDLMVKIAYPQLEFTREKIRLGQLRILKDWNLETGEWTIRGQYKPQ